MSNDKKLESIAPTDLELTAGGVLGAFGVSTGSCAADVALGAAAGAVGGTALGGPVFGVAGAANWGAATYITSPACKKK
ncbi:MAG TPA: hypothetical protein VIV11_22295 [Kofleriaceae bacterium]